MRTARAIRRSPWFLIGLLVWLPLALAEEPDPFESLDINEGELRFLTRPPKRPPHLQSTHLVISEESLKTGWIKSKQCHYHLDRVSAMQVVFSHANTRGLQILEATNIGRAWVEDASVQLEKVGSDAVLCIYSEHRALRRSELDAGFDWRGGPYLRRFLDGYFPMHLKLAIDYPADFLRVDSIEPSALKLKTINHPGHIRIDALFEGRLTVNIHFNTATGSPGIGWH